MPGFVDAHTHLAFPPAGIREAEPAAAMRALHTATGHRLEVRTRAYLEAMARHGTTTVEVKTACGLDGDAEAKLLRMLWALRARSARSGAQLSLPPTQRTQWRVDAGHRMGRSRTASQGPAAAGVASFADLAWDCDPALLPYFDRYLAAARELGFGCKIHADGADPSGAIALAMRHRAASVDHLEHATECDVRQLAEAGIIATLLPRVTFGGGPDAPGAGLDRCRRGCRAGHQLQSARFADAEHADRRLRWPAGGWGMTIEEALSAATINGAYALGCADRLGSLEPGKSADLLILNAGHLPGPGAQPGHQPGPPYDEARQLIYKEGRSGTAASERLAVVESRTGNKKAGRPCGRPAGLALLGQITSRTPRWWRLLSGPQVRTRSRCRPSW